MTNFKNNFMENGIDFIPIIQLYIFPDISLLILLKMEYGHVAVA